MNKNEKDFMNQLSNLDDFSVEEIAENYPALDENTKKRILKKCMKKNSLSAETDYDRKKKITVSGIEHYNRALWHKYASSAAAFILAFVGIASVVIINRNLSGNSNIEKDPTQTTNIYSATVNTSETTVTTSYELTSEYKTTGENTSVVSNNTTVQPATQSPFTSPTATQAPATSPNTTKTPVTSSVTTSVTDTIQTEPQKSPLNGLYYVEIEGVSYYCEEIAGVRGYMSFEFWPDGRLTKCELNDFGDPIYSSMITDDYKIVENQFSFGSIHKKVGTIVNANDTGNFSIQFEDGLYNLSTERPKFRNPSSVATEPDTLNGTIFSWYGNIDENYNFIDKKQLEFNEDGVSGTEYIIFYPNDAAKRVITEIPFTYEQNGGEFTFYMEDSDYNILKATLRGTESSEKLLFDIEYQNGDRNFFALTGYLNN
ncbi:MAG: hypothetical protein K2N27_09450 [Ruminococcus sp.]|nr:hypothetical protein [Ruminococcus sp.]